MNVLINDENMGETVGEITGVNVDSGGDACDDNVMMDASVLSSAAVLSASVHASAFSAVSAFSAACASSAALNSTSSAHINPPLSFHTDFSLSSTLLEMLCIFSGPSLYLSYPPSALTASEKMCFHT
ncbi:hypothetical protein I7I50_09049 [Histoplasma capsulatum G186AR]|uniref:Uncharacterized protein n=1 Tax=Ajellomyces capsulatus TaxID=5037 RepID=A0A8H7YRX3_AJECA|nr:hypothetical protein I7I52_06566 [Histoplasma capsulatum]QSS74048.1 hypothetical protein I7I50_09049 [Histoplasma capsulatum G186AR]